MQISILNGSVEYDGIPCLSEINFTVRDKEKIALVGRNGCGKTTLLKAITGKLPLVKGTGDEALGFYITGKPTIGYLEQVAFSDERVKMYDEVLRAYDRVIEIEKNMETALKRMEENSSAENVKKYSDLQEAFELNDGYIYKKECLTAIRKFGFSDGDKEKPLNEFSGGQRTKIALLKMLLSRPDVLLLDEPTNHLDVEAVDWLENFLKTYKNACVIVSHDRMFLDRIVNVVYEIEYGEAKRYKANYTEFTRQKQEAYDKAVKDAALKAKERARLEAIVEKFRYKANKAAMAQAKLSQLKRMGEVENPEKFDDRTFASNFQPQEMPSREAVIMEKLSFGYQRPLGEITVTVESGDKMGIIGGNGCGKSTLIKTLMGNIKPISGFSRFGFGVKIGYFDQTSTQTMSESTVLEDFQQEFPTLNNTEARRALGAFMISGEDVFKQLKDLSGGEKVRYALCKILKRKPNTLILDEPTNHMDIVGKETFEKLLKEYTGVIIVVSHDRYLINKICNKLLVFSNDGVKYYPCGFAEYERQIKEISEETKEEKQEVKKDISDAKRHYVNNSNAQKRERRIAFLENKITIVETEIGELEEKINSPEVCCDYVKIQELQNNIDELNAEILPLLEEWETLNEQ